MLHSLLYTSADWVSDNLKPAGNKVNKEVCQKYTDVVPPWKTRCQIDYWYWNVVITV